MRLITLLIEGCILESLKTLYVGRKHVMDYVILARNFLKTTDKIIIAGRGKWISKVVNATEILKRDGVKVVEIKIASEQVQNRAGRQQFISVITITVTNT